MTCLWPRPKALWPRAVGGLLCRPQRADPSTRRLPSWFRGIFGRNRRVNFFSYKSTLLGGSDRGEGRRAKVRPDGRRGGRVARKWAGMGCSEPIGLLFGQIGAFLGGSDPALGTPVPNLSLSQSVFSVYIGNSKISSKNPNRVPWNEKRQNH